MDAQTFLSEFAHISDAPGGVDQLRQMIYQLAVTGALTPRSEKSEDARALLESIGVRRQALIREKKYKRMVELEGEAIATPFGITLPSTWCWSRLLDVGEINPRNHADEDVKAAFLPMSGVPQVHRGGVVADTAKWGDIKKGYTHFASGDVVLAKITPCFENGKAAVIEALPAGCVIGAGTTELHVFRPIHAGVLPEYVYLFLKSPLFAAEGVKNMTGTAGQKRLPTDFFATRAFPLPPAEEQSRIVAKVDELMALCDRLEAKQQAQHKMQNKLRETILHAVVSSTKPFELQASWLRLADLFREIFDAPVEIDQLRQLIYQLAITGRLSFRSDQDGDAREQLSEISLARRSMIRDKQYRRLPKLESEPVSAPADIELPPSWCWTRLLDVGEIGPRNNVSDNSAASFVPMSGIPRTHKGALIAKDRAWIDIKKGFTHFANGDVVVAKITPCFENGKAALIGRLPANIGAGTTELHVFRSIHHGLLPEYVYLFIRSPYFTAGGERHMTGTAGQKRLPTEYFATRPLPFPPSEEQRRIVKKVDELMVFCDFFESQLFGKNDLSSRLATAAVSSITGIGIESKEDAPMKTPQTELIAPLRLGKPPGVKAQAPLATILARHKGEMSARDLWQRFTGEIDVFYAQLKTEIAHGWILEPGVAEMREKASEDAGG